ncbi:MAG: hypothetical protein ACD_44C00475G0008, partial [uncultured bacterium]
MLKSACLQKSLEPVQYLWAQATKINFVILSETH